VVSRILGFRYGLISLGCWIPTLAQSTPTPGGRATSSLFFLFVRCDQFPEAHSPGPESVAEKDRSQCLPAASAEDDEAVGL